MLQAPFPEGLRIVAILPSSKRRMKQQTVALVLALALLPLPGSARTFREQLLLLELQTRKEQRCAGHTVGSVRREHRGFNPDEMANYAFAPVTVHDRTVTALGAAIRDHGQWYRVSYVCRTTPDGLDIEAFDYSLGEPIPRTEWAAHDLVPQ